MNTRRTSTWAAVALTVTAFVVSTPLAAQSPGRSAEPAASRGYAPAIDFARTLVKAMMEESGTPGVSLAVGIDGKIVWSEGFGYADVEHRVPVWEDTRFRIGSVSKPLTAAALGLLYEQGRLDLDAPIQDYVPTFPAKRWPISSRQVAGHLAGIRHYRDQEFLSARHYESVLQGLEIFEADSLLFEPGTRYSYSSYGWNLISGVVEGASGVDFLVYMRENVFDRLGMEHTIADHTDSIIAQRTGFYQRTDDGRIINARYVDNSYKWAGGGFLSTPEDLLGFGFAHLDGGFLKPETVDLLWTSQRTSDGQATNYGIGWAVTTEDGRVTQASHGGGSIGGTTFLLIRPEERAVLAIVGNLTQAPTSSPAGLILDSFLDPATLISEEGGRAVRGTYECSAVAGEEEIAAGIIEIRGSPGEYWGRMEWSNGTKDRIIYSVSDPSATWLVTVDGRGSLTSIRFTGADEDALTGSWRSGGSGGELSCNRN